MIKDKKMELLTWIIGSVLIFGIIFILFYFEIPIATIFEGLEKVNPFRFTVMIVIIIIIVILTISIMLYKLRKNKKEDVIIIES